MSVIDKQIMLRSMQWLQQYNPLIQLYGFRVKKWNCRDEKNKELKEAQISEKIDSNGNHHESVRVNPMLFESEMRNEDYGTYI
jgi:hypothetical protein